MWFVVCSSINCLPTNPLISGKFYEHHINNRSAEENANNSHALNISTDITNSARIQLDENVFNDSRPPLETHKRVKRLHVFRPLFVYRQEKIERQRINGHEIHHEKNHDRRKLHDVHGHNQIGHKNNVDCCKCDCCGRH